MDSLRFQAVNHGVILKPCLQLGCPDVAPRGTSYCEAHAPEPWAQRGNFRSRFGMSRFAWDKLRARAIRRDGGKCVTCGATDDLEVDHVTPRSAGGSNALANLATLCNTCHTAKTHADQAATRRQRAR